MLYLARPNSDGYLTGETTEIPEGTFDWGYYTGTDATIRAATSWTAGSANVFYDAAGAPIVCLASEIVAWAGINTATTLFKLIDGTAQTGRLAIYAAGTDAAIITTAKKVLKIS